MFADLSVNPYLDNSNDRYQRSSLSISIEKPHSKHFKDSGNSSQIYLKQISLLNSLEAVIKRASVANWDDEDGYPVNPSAAEYMKTLLSYFPLDLSKPDLYPAPDGTIGMDWEFSDGTSLVATMMPSGEIAFSVYGEKEKSYGAIRWDKLSFPIQLFNIIKTYE